MTSRSLQQAAAGNVVSYEEAVMALEAAFDEVSILGYLWLHRLRLLHTHTHIYIYAAMSELNNLYFKLYFSDVHLT